MNSSVFGVIRCIMQAQYKMSSYSYCMLKSTFGYACPIKSRLECECVEYVNASSENQALKSLLYFDKKTVEVWL